MRTYPKALAVTVNVALHFAAVIMGLLTVMLVGLGVMGG